MRLQGPDTDEVLFLCVPDPLPSPPLAPSPCSSPFAQPMILCPYPPPSPISSLTGLVTTLACV
ncbi:hypothetical protein COCON_G00108510 [Conger conger]|uniref:Uncharacterized protein n=1 Tax=Conger conger TaxID=82655 RepID=A0A9Q1HZZ6_CONCO|nr:hypothetical protein COCON_G00108510 [Conger conger]